MKWSQQQYDKYINKALSMVEAGTTIEEIREEEGKIKGKKPKDYQPYYLKYPWRTQEEVDKFREYLLVENRKLHSPEVEEKIQMDVDFLESLVSLSEINIIHEHMKLINEPLKEEKL